MTGSTTIERLPSIDGPTEPLLRVGLVDITNIGRFVLQEEALEVAEGFNSTLDRALADLYGCSFEKLDRLKVEAYIHRGDYRARVNRYYEEGEVLVRTLVTPVPSNRSRGINLYRAVSTIDAPQLPLVGESHSFFRDPALCEVTAFPLGIAPHARAETYHLRDLATIMEQNTQQGTQLFVKIPEVG